MDYGDPVSYLVLKKGVDVFSSEGQRVGTLKQVVADEATSIFDGLVIDIKAGPGGRRYVDAEDIDQLYERAVVLALTAQQIQQLSPPA